MKDRNIEQLSIDMDSREREFCRVWYFEPMDFNNSSRTAEMQKKLQQFMEAEVYPNEQRFHDEINKGDRWQPSELIDELKVKA